MSCKDKKYDKCDECHDDFDFHHDYCYDQMPYHQPMVMCHYHYIMRPLHHIMHRPMPCPRPPYPPTMPQPKCMWYTVKAGDTMYSIAQRNNISLNELIAANPQIQNPDLIFPGQRICIPLSPVMPGEQMPATTPPMAGPGMMPGMGAGPMPCPGMMQPGMGAGLMPGPGMMQPGMGAGPMPGPGMMPGMGAGPMPVEPGMSPGTGAGPIMEPGMMPGCTMYTVQPGDTMYNIAQKNNLSLNELIAANPQITNPSLIYPGQKICIPNGDNEDCMWYTVRRGDSMYTIAQRYKIPLDELIAANPQIEDPELIFPGQKICIPQ